MTLIEEEKIRIELAKAAMTAIIQKLPITDIKCLENFNSNDYYEVSITAIRFADRLLDLLKHQKPII